MEAMINKMEGPRDRGEKPCRTCTDFRSWMKTGPAAAKPETPKAEATETSSKFTEDDLEYAKRERQQCPLDTAELGKATWKFLHTMSVKYPEKPSETEKKEMTSFVGLFSKFYPCDCCAEEMRSDLVKNPPNVESGPGFAQWMCRMHNRVNVRLGKKEFDYSRMAAAVRFVSPPLGRQIFHRTLATSPIKLSSSCDYFDGEETPIEDIKEQFSTFNGGSIDLKCNNGNGIAHLVFENPERRNAISGKMMCQLHDAVLKLEQWPEGKGVIVRSPGQIFCAGGDLTTVNQVNDPQGGFKMATLMHETLCRFLALPLITVAFVDGPAIGGGAELTLWTDFRLMSELATVAFVQSKMGVATGWGGGTRLVELIGQAKALDLMLTNKKVDREMAVALGLCNDIAETEKEAEEWLLHRTGSTAPEVIRALKNINRNAHTLNRDEALRMERRAFAPLWGGRANKAALERNIKHR